VVSELRRDLPSEQSGQSDLATGRVEQISASNDEVDALDHVVHGDRKVIGPVTVAVPNQQVTAFPCRVLLVPTGQEVVEVFVLFEQLDTQRG